MLLFALALAGCIVHPDCEETEATTDTGSVSVSVPTTRPDCVEDFALQVVDADTVIEAGCVTRILESVAIGSGATLTIEAGAWVEVARGATLWVGRDGRGRLVADGTEEAPVHRRERDGPVTLTQAGRPRVHVSGMGLDDQQRELIRSFRDWLESTVRPNAGPPERCDREDASSLVTRWPAGTRNVADDPLRE